MQKISKVLDTGLEFLTKAPGALSSGGEGTGHLLQSLRSPGRRVSEPGFCAPENQLRREREREQVSKKERHGDPSYDGVKVLY